MRGFTMMPGFLAGPPLPLKQAGGGGATGSTGGSRRFMRCPGMGLMGSDVRTLVLTAALAAFIVAGPCRPAEAGSLLPGVVHEIDPALPVTAKALAGPGIQTDAAGGIVAMRLAGSGAVLRRGSGQSTLAPDGLDGRPIIRNPAGGSPGGWDSLAFDPAAADPISARRGQPFTVALVARRQALRSCDIMKLYAKNGTHLHFSAKEDGAILIGQNDGPGVATEDAPGPTGQWDILYYVYDGRAARLLRNGVVTATTPAYQGGGFGQEGAAVFEVLNGCALDVAWMAIAAQAPSAAQLNAETARLRGLFPSVAPQAEVAGGVLAAASQPAFERDASASFLTTPNHPLAEPLPAKPGAMPGHGLAMAPGSRNAFSLVMGAAQPGANMTTGQSVRDRFYLSYMQGDLNKAIGSPMDTGQKDNGTFAAVARHFPVGDPNDLHVMKPDGLHLRAMCSANRTDCRPGQVWGR